jgi:hypothetical protein
VRARQPAPDQHEQEHNTQQHPPSLKLDIPTRLLRPCLFDSEATDDAALPIHRHSYKRQAACKKGTEYGARAKGALVSCVHPACRAIGYLQSLAPGKVFMRRDYLRSSMLSLARWLTALARWCRVSTTEAFECATRIGTREEPCPEPDSRLLCVMSSCYHSAGVSMKHMSAVVSS